MTSEKHQLHNKGPSLNYYSDDEDTVATEPMTDDEDQEEELDAEECQEN